jgi:DsbC/DsbD-like thiol-disulfide interchange protein
MLSLCLATLAQAQDANRQNRAAVELVPSISHAKPGESFEVAVRFQIERGWHLYWLNPGDSGLPPSVEWSLPEGVSVGPLRFPFPHRIQAGEGIESFGYEDELVLLADVRVSPDVKGPIALRGKVSWLVCKDVCLAESAEASVDVPVGAVGKPDDRFAGWRDKLPNADPSTMIAGASVAFSDDRKSGRIVVRLRPGEAADLTKHDVFPPAVEQAVFGKPEAVVASDGHAVVVPFRVLSGSAGAEPVMGEALFVRTDADGRRTACAVPLSFEFSK